jgi:hypothetical protein
MSNIEQKTPNVSESVKDTSIEQDTGDDIKEYGFYKDPVFICITLYTLFIFITYINMGETVKRSYVFNNKFRDRYGKIYWNYILTYPYNPYKSTGSLIMSAISPPIIWYLTTFTILIQFFIDLNQVQYQAYFYSLMFSYLLLMILFSIHIIVFNLILQPQFTNVELQLDGDEDSDKKTYKGFYRTQWILLLFLSPIYVCFIVYIFRLLNSKED